MKTDLSPEEKLIAAYAVDIVGLTQQQVAIVLNVSNVARVNEACTAVREAVGLAKNNDLGNNPRQKPLSYLDGGPLVGGRRSEPPEITTLTKGIMG